MLATDGAEMELKELLRRSMSEYHYNSESVLQR